jgi:hypothetical protein
MLCPLDDTAIANIGAYISDVIAAPAAAGLTGQERRPPSG